MTAIVCLSGGLDSTAALCWARRTGDAVHAILFDYGQPNRDRELACAARVCTALRVPRTSIVLAESLPRASGLLRAVEDHDGKTEGRSQAFVPGRNAVFAVSAAAHAAARFPAGDLSIVLGCNGDDARRFDDCTPEFMRLLEPLLRAATGRRVHVVTPWGAMPKSKVLGLVHPHDLDLVAESWSCYRGGERPCGSCSACALRAEAFVANGLLDASRADPMTGGDPHRCR